MLRKERFILSCSDSGGSFASDWLDSTKHLDEHFPKVCIGEDIDVITERYTVHSSEKIFIAALEMGVDKLKMAPLEWRWMGLDGAAALLCTARSRGYSHDLGSTS